MFKSGRAFGPRASLIMGIHLCMNSGGRAQAQVAALQTPASVQFNASAVPTRAVQSMSSGDALASLRKIPHRSSMVRSYRPPFAQEFEQWGGVAGAAVRQPLPQKYPTTWPNAEFGRRAPFGARRHRFPQERRTTSTLAKSPRRLPRLSYLPRLQANPHARQAARPESKRVPKGAKRLPGHRPER
mgnify:CR=1 FL=1